MAKQKEEVNIIGNLNDILGGLNDIKSLIKQKAPQQFGGGGGNGQSGQSGGSGQGNGNGEGGDQQEQERNEMLRILQQVLQLIDQIKTKANLPENAKVKDEVLSRINEVFPQIEKLYKKYNEG